MSSEPASPPNTWGKAMRAFTDEWFQKRLSSCRSIQHIRSALEYEAERREVRSERIARLNQRAKEVKRLE